MKVAQVQSNFRCLGFIQMLCVTFLILGVILENRLMSYGHGHHINCAIFVYPVFCILLDITAEVYGYRVARRLLWLSIIATLIFALVIQLIMFLPAPSFWQAYTNDFDVVMAHIFRFVGLGTISLLAGQFVNIYVITKLKVLVRGRFFAFRSIGSTMIGDTIVVTLTLSSVFAARMSAYKIFVMITNDLLTFFIAAFVLSIPGTIVVHFLKKIERVDAYDVGINFNPFSMKVS